MNSVSHFTENRHLVEFDFWGTTVRVYVPHRSDITHLNYYFEDFVTLVDAPDIEIYLCSNGQPFTAPGGMKSVRVRYRNHEWREHDSYSIESKNPTPLPPFSLRPLNESLVTLHASAATPPDRSDRALVIHGPSTSGKSTLLRRLSESRWRFVTDDTLVRRKSDGRLLRYCRPLGIRQAAYENDPQLRRATEGAIEFSTPTGVTRAASATALGFHLADRESQWTWTVVLEKAGQFTAKRLGPSTMLLGLDVDRHLDQAVSAVTSLVSEQTEAL